MDLNGFEKIYTHTHTILTYILYYIFTPIHIYIYICTFDHKMLSRFFIQQPFGSTWLFYDTKDIATTGLPSRPFRWFIMHARSCCSYVMIREAKCKVHRRWLLGTMNHEAMKPWSQIKYDSPPLLALGVMDWWVAAESPGCRFSDQLPCCRVALGSLGSRAVPGSVDPSLWRLRRRATDAWTRRKLATSKTRQCPFRSNWFYLGMS